MRHLTVQAANRSNVLTEKSRLIGLAARLPTFRTLVPYPWKAAFFAQDIF
jgi:hypothetical protein